LGIFSSLQAHTLEEENFLKKNEGKRGRMVLRVGGENGERSKKEGKKILGEK
jgi:hypothetical protein